MLGAIIGDVVGSSREFAPIKSKEFDLFDEGSIYTDDTILTVAVAAAIIDGVDLAARLKEYANEYVTSYGPGFWSWASSPELLPAYGSWGNGASMRVSPAAWLARDLHHALELARLSALPTHNHPEGIRGAQATTLAIYLARAGYSSSQIRAIVTEKSGYDLSRSVDQVRSTCIFELKSWISVPEALICALEASSFEDAIRNAVSIGGDADTQAAIAGAIAEAMFGIPDGLAEQALAKVPPAVRETALQSQTSIKPVVDPASYLASIPVWDPEETIAFDRIARGVDEAMLKRIDDIDEQQRLFQREWSQPISKPWPSIGDMVRIAVDRFKAWRSKPAEVARVDARGPEASDTQSSKLAETKLRWAVEGRFLTGRRSDPSTERLPPGQHLTESWPVLDLGPKPYIDMDTWRLEVSGDVEAPQSFTWQEILDLPQTSSVSDIHCVTSWSRYDNAWEGISTADLIALIRPGQSVRYVQLISCDGYTTNLPLDDFARAGCLLAHSWEGRPLTRVHGAPLRLVIPHLYFWKSAKWLKAVRFSSDDEPGYWETRGYHNYGDPWREQRYRGR